MQGGQGQVAVPTRLEVPESVKDAYAGIVLLWKDSSTGKEGRLSVPLDGSAELPDSGLTVSADVFLPAFTMTADVITSSGDRPGESRRADPGEREGRRDLLRLDLPAIPRRSPLHAFPLLPSPGRRAAEAEQVRSGTFRVVIAGRPNVGKSAIFNRLAKRRRSLVHDLPGVTRDVLEEEVTLPDGRAFLLFDTGGFDPSGQEEIPAAVRRKAIEAIRKADLILLVVDGAAGIVSGRPGRGRGGAAVGQGDHRRRQQDRSEGSRGGGARGLGAGLRGGARRFGRALDRDRRHPRGGGITAAPGVRGDGGGAGRTEGPGDRARRRRAPQRREVVARQRAARFRALDRLGGRRHHARRRRRSARVEGTRLPSGGHGRHPAQGQDGKRPRGALRRTGAPPDRAVRRRHPRSRRRGRADGPGRDGGLVRERRGQGPRDRRQQVGPRGPLGQGGGGGGQGGAARHRGRDPLCAPRAGALRVGEDEAGSGTGPRGRGGGGRESVPSDPDGCPEPRPRPRPARQGAPHGLRQEPSRPLRRPDRDRPADLHARLEPLREAPFLRGAAGREPPPRGGGLRRIPHPDRGAGAVGGGAGAGKGGGGRNSSDSSRKRAEALE